MDVTAPGSGIEHAPTASLLAALLHGSPARRAALAEHLLAEVGLGRLGRAGDVGDAGAGAAEAARVAAAVELGRRALAPPPPAASITAPQQAYAAVAPRLVGAETERFVVVVVDVRNRPLHVCTVAAGAVDSCPVDPREVFLPAVRERGSAVLVAHNHPSGDPTPSPEDIALTRRLHSAGELLGLPLLDHIIVGAPPRFHSFAEAGMLAAA